MLVHHLSHHQKMGKGRIREYILINKHQVLIRIKYVFKII